MSERQVKAAEVVKVLTEAKKRIATPDKWCRGSMHQSGGKSCAIGAIHKVAHHSTPLWVPALHALEEACGEWPPSYNDRRSTKHADVLAKFDLAIEQQCKIVREEAEKDDSHLSD